MAENFAREATIDENCMSHACRNLFKKVKYVSVAFHHARCAIRRQQLIWEMAIEKDTATPASQEWDWERDLIKDVAVESACEQNDPQGAKEHSNVGAKSLASTED